MVLNNRFDSYDAWNSYYRWNPDRWYYDRFYALQNILGSRIFAVYQNAYFRGASPFAYYRNRCVNFYARRYPVRPAYRNVNINIYKVNRGNFREGFRNVVRNQNMIQPNRNNGRVSTQPIRSGANGNNIGGIRSPQNQGMRNQQNAGIRYNENGGFRNQAGIRNGNDNFRNQSSYGNRVEGMRNQNSGIRQNQNAERKIDNRNSNQRNSKPKSEKSARNNESRLASR